MSRTTLLGVWAHPDDEAYLSAGLMALARRLGYRVAVLTATLGEHGTSDPRQWPPRRLAARRHAELRSSLAHLDVDELYVLGYEDGRCDATDGTEAVARYLADIVPDVIVTFGPDGITGHPDHVAVSRWTTDAWSAVCPSADLWYATFTDESHRTWGGVYESIGLFADQPDPPWTPASDAALDLRLPDVLLDRKIAALEAHASQTGPLIDFMGMETYRECWRTESFRWADPSRALTPARGGIVRTDRA